MNSANIIGNLTRDPELRHTPSGLAVCKLGVAVNERVKKDDEWVEKANFFDVVVFGGQGETVAQYLEKGRQVGVQGRLSWSSWETDDGQKRSKVEIVADRVDFLGGGQGEGGKKTATPATEPSTDAETAKGGQDDDIPF